MLVFQLNLSQRDGVVNLFNRLNELMIVSNDLSLEEIKEMAMETSRQIIMLNKLKLASEGEQVKESQCSPADESIERPTKRSKTEAFEQIIFEIQLDDILQIIAKIIKNQKVAIQYRASVLSADKVRLMQENFDVIGLLQRLPLKMNGAVNGGSSGNRPPDARTVSSNWPDEIVTSLKHPATAQHRAEESVSDATTNDSEETDNLNRSAKSPSVSGENWSSNFSDWSSSSTTQIPTVPKLTESTRPTKPSAHHRESPTETNAGSPNVPDQDAGGSDDRSDDRSDGRSADAVITVPNHSGEDSVIGSASANSKVEPSNDSDPTKGLSDESSFTYCLEGVRQFFAHCQQRSSEFWLSNGSTALKFNFEIGVRKLLNGKRFLNVALCSHSDFEVDICARVSLLSQVAGQANKPKLARFKFTASCDKCEFPRFISYVDLKDSAHLSNDRLHFQFYCSLVSVKIPKKPTDELTEEHPK